MHTAGSTSLTHLLTHSLTNPFLEPDILSVSKYSEATKDFLKVKPSIVFVV
jgi:hypothetical protein